MNINGYIYITQMRPSDFVVVTCKYMQPDERILMSSACYQENSDDSDDDWFLPTIDSIVFITSNGFELQLVNLHGRVTNLSVSKCMYGKASLSNSISDGARKYWRKWCHREYQLAVAQWLVRELELPGEVAMAISEFV